MGAKAILERMMQELNETGWPSDATWKAARKATGWPALKPLPSAGKAMTALDVVAHGPRKFNPDA